MKIEIAGYSYFQEVTVHELPNYKGWDILHSYDTVVTHTRYEYVNGQQVPLQVQEHRQVFLVGRPSEGSMAEMLDEVAKRVAEREEWSRKHDDVSGRLRHETSEHSATRRALDEANLVLKRQVELTERISAKIDPMNARMRKMEADLAAIEKAIGTIEFNKIVGGPVRS